MKSLSIYNHRFVRLNMNSSIHCGFDIFNFFIILARNYHHITGLIADHFVEIIITTINLFVPKSWLVFSSIIALNTIQITL